MALEEEEDKDNGTIYKGRDRRGRKKSKDRRMEPGRRRKKEVDRYGQLRKERGG